MFYAKYSHLGHMTPKSAMGKLDFLAENSAAKKFCSAKNRRQTDG